MIWKLKQRASQNFIFIVHFGSNTKNSAFFQAKAKGKKLGEYFESWMGDVKREGGGASLNFENPADKIGAVDVRFARRLILRVLEIMYYEEKWEKLVDVALRFNALTK